MAWLAVCSVSAAVILSHATIRCECDSYCRCCRAQPGVQWSVRQFARLIRARGLLRFSGQLFPGHRPILVSFQRWHTSRRSGYPAVVR